MPKQSGQDNKTVRQAPLPQPKSRPIMHQEVPKGPLVRPMSPGADKQADKLKQDPSGGIDPRQQIY
jgi:hypothetical protein